MSDPDEEPRRPKRSRLPALFFGLLALPVGAGCLVLPIAYCGSTMNSMWTMFSRSSQGDMTMFVAPLLAVLTVSVAALIGVLMGDRGGIFLRLVAAVTAVLVLLPWPISSFLVMLSVMHGYSACQGAIITPIGLLIVAFPVGAALLCGLFVLMGRTLPGWLWAIGGVGGIGTFLLATVLSLLRIGI